MKTHNPVEHRFFNMDCISGCKIHIENNSVDLIITDPPYGIEGDKLDKHYNRNEQHVIEGYVEIPSSEYPSFSVQWIKEAERVLKPGGSIYIISGYTNLVHILNALRETQLQEKNHLIWKYNFGVYTKKKYISSHYHILFYTKKGKSHTFNTFTRYADNEKTDNGRSLNYSDREDVWIINREYKPGQIKNKNQLPNQLLIKLIQYSSNEGDLVCDFFLGSFSTAKVAKGLNRRSTGFEISKNAFDYQIQEFENLKAGYLLEQLRTPPENTYINSGKPISEEVYNQILRLHVNQILGGMTKKQSILRISEKFGRSYKSTLRIVEESANKKSLKKFNGLHEMLFPEEVKS